MSEATARAEAERRYPHALKNLQYHTALSLDAFVAGAVWAEQEAAKKAQAHG